MSHPLHHTDGLVIMYLVVVTVQLFSWTLDPTFCAPFCTLVSWHPVHILHLVWIFTALHGTQWSDHPSLTFGKGMQAVPIHCHFPLRHRCQTLGCAKVKINPRQICSGHNVRPHTAPCLSLTVMSWLWSHWRLEFQGAEDDFGQWDHEIKKWNKVRAIKGCRLYSLQHETSVAFVSSFKIEQTSNKGKIRWMWSEQKHN